MKKFILFTLILSPILMFSQSKTTVNVTNVFTPAAVTITVGDTVEFVNSSGSHWVDGTQGTFSGNPVSFDNQSQSGPGWTYQQVFNTVGFYNYRCGIHTSTMSGTIDVQASTNVNEAKTISSHSYPNPVVDYLYLTNISEMESIEIFSVSGKRVYASEMIKNKINLTFLEKGVYFTKVKMINNEIITKKILIQ
jgi:plastocyanin